MSPPALAQRGAVRRRSGACPPPHPSLFGAAGAVAPPSPATSPVAAPAGAPAPVGGTLEALVTGLWTGAMHCETATCPLCAGALAPRWSAGAGVVGARCRSCGTELD